MIIDGTQSTNKSIDSFLMIGQSNMAGRGTIGTVAPIYNEQCLMLRNGRWQQMAEPINPDRAIFDGDFTSGIGLAASFADNYASTTNRYVGLIPCADGGTKISQWQPGEVLFDNAVFQTKLAQRSSTLKGILWHQGESDCNSDFDISTYYNKFNLMITELRLQLQNPSLPIIIGEVSENISEKWQMGERNKRLNLILNSLAKDLSYVKIVSAKDLTLKSDGLHFDAPSCRELGNRYFSVFQEHFL